MIGVEKRAPRLPPGITAKPDDEKLLARDLATLVKFIDVYCQAHHQCQTPVSMKSADIAAIAGKEVSLCPECAKLMKHALVKRSACPWDPKPQCKHCPEHCYAPVYQKMIRDVMRFSGMKLLLRGRVDYLLHLLF